LYINSLEEVAVSLKLTPTELSIFNLLEESGNQVLSKEQILRLIWKTDYQEDTRVIHNHIRNLRKKLRASGCGLDIQCVRNKGYQLVQRVV